MTDTITPSILDRINDDSVWSAFIERKRAFDPYSSDADRYEAMFSNDRCRSVCASISDGTHVFSTPRKKLIAKNRTGKKRTVYQFNEYEMMSLKIVADQLYDYDWLFSPNLYSFRRNVSAGNAVKKIFTGGNLSRKWGYKADVHNYFNSIDTDRLLSRLEADIADERLLSLFRSILSNPDVMYRGETIQEQKGVMAGVPISAFHANYYLKDVDEYFGGLDCTYMRYADDILILADSEDEILEYRDTLIRMIQDEGLEMNPDKELFFHPGQELEFLGFRISSRGIDIGENTIRKMKGKIRRSARSIRRWMLEKGAPVEGTIRALIRDYNNRFYGYQDGEISWASWYFSTITTTDSIHEIDLYLQDWIRYVATGRHNKMNYSVVPYEMIQRCGYMPLVSRYYNR